MIQTKVSLSPEHVEFLKKHKKFGYRNRSDLVREALTRLQKELEQQKLTASADLYAELFDGDDELSKLTEAAIEGWPE